MEARKISVKLRRDPRETAERHSQANPLTLECTLATGEAVTETMELRAELHAAQTPATTPLAATAAVNMTSGSTGPWDLVFSGAQMNQTVLPDSSTDFWLVVYATDADDNLFTLGKIALTLTFDNVSQVTPSPPEPPLYATFAFRTFAVAGQSSVVAETTADTLTLVAGSNITITTNASTDTITIASTGGGGGATSLTMTRTANSVTITPSGGGTAAEILQANNTSAGVLTAAHHQTIENLGTISTQSAANVTITGGAITGTTVSGITLTNGGSGALTVTGTASIAGASSGTNTGDQTITLTGDVTGSGTGSFAATLANSGVTAGSYIRATITVDAKGRVTAASSNSAGEINGSAGTVDNGIVRADGTGGNAVQGSSIVIDDATTATANNVTIAVSHSGQTNSSLVLTPQGNGAFIVGPKPDGTTTGGNARGTDAVDFQRSRNAITQVAGAPSSFIAGGARNATSGGAGQEYSFVGCGFNNAASGYSSAVFGASCTASGSRSFAAGQSSTASGIISAAFGGSTASATYSFSIGNASVANRLGMMAHANGLFSTAGDAQRGVVVMRRQTTDATPANLSLDGAAPTGSTITTSTHFILLNNQTCFIEVGIVARSSSGTDVAGFRRNVVVSRNANAASTTITGLQVVGVDIKSAGATPWDVTLSADTTNGGLLVTVTGAAATNINWTADVRVVETIRT